MVEKKASPGRARHLGFALFDDRKQCTFLFENNADNADHEAEDPCRMMTRRPRWNFAQTRPRRDFEHIWSRAPTLWEHVSSKVVRASWRCRDILASGLEAPLAATPSPPPQLSRRRTGHFSLELGSSLREPTDLRSTHRGEPRGTALCVESRSAERTPQASCIEAKVIVLGSMAQRVRGLAALVRRSWCVAAQIELILCELGVDIELAILHVSVTGRSSSRMRSPWIPVLCRAFAQSGVREKSFAKCRQSTR